MKNIRNTILTTLFILATAFLLSVGVSADDGWTSGNVLNRKTSATTTLAAPSTGYIHVKMQIVPNIKNGSWMKFRLLDGTGAYIPNLEGYENTQIRPSANSYSTKDVYWPVTQGAYTLSCNGYGYIDFRYQYEFISKPIPYDAEPNNSILQAAACPADTTISGLIRKDSDTVDMYTFTIYKKQNVQARLVGYTRCMELSIYNEKDRKVLVLHANNGNVLVPSVTQKAITLQPGKYYVKISRWASGISGFYDFMMNYDSSRPVQASSVSINGLPSKTTVGTKSATTVTFLPANTENRSVSWSSSNTSVATVSSNGTVTAKRPGKTIITATAKDGSGKSCSKYLTVFPEKVAKISAKKTAKTTLSVAWTKANGAEYYQVQFSTDKNFKNTVSIKVKSSSLKKSVTVKSGKTWYVRVRAFKNVDGKNYCGAWSAVQKAKF